MTYGSFKILFMVEKFVENCMGYPIFSTSCSQFMDSNINEGTNNLHHLLTLLGATQQFFRRKQIWGVDIINLTVSSLAQEANHFKGGGELAPPPPPPTFPFEQTLIYCLCVHVGTSSNV